MSESRQGLSRVRSYSVTHPPGQVALPDAPGWDLLVLADAALVTAHADDRWWTIPRGRALWRPDGPRVSIRVARRSPVRCLYLKTGLVRTPVETCVLSLDPLVRELVSVAIAEAPMDLEQEADRALVTLLADRLARGSALPLDLHQPRDPVARALADAILAEPHVDLTALVAQVGGGRRTLERRFRDETGTSLGHWRRRARILTAVSMLDDDMSVTTVAVSLGYSSPSALVAAFRAELGAPPLTFVAGRRERRQSSRSSGSGTGSL